MRVLFFFTAHPRLDMIMKIQAEILMTHILNKDKIYIVNNFDNGIAKSQINYNSTKSNLYYYKSMFENLINTLRNKGGDITILGYKHTKDFRNQEFNNIQELKDYTYLPYTEKEFADEELLKRYEQYVKKARKSEKNKAVVAIILMFAHQILMSIVPTAMDIFSFF